MSKVLSVDLRTRVLAAVSAGASHREAAGPFGVFEERRPAVERPTSAAK